MEDHEKYMRRALELAQQAAEMGEVPVGAVIVRKTTGEIVGEGYNRRETDKHALAHAEIMAIDAACRRLGGWRLPECAMYVTLEPCPMCSGAMLHARIDEVYFGAYDAKSGALCSVEQMYALPYNHHPAVQGGMLQEECSGILSAFFRMLRQKKAAEKKQS